MISNTSRAVIGLCLAALVVAASAAAPDIAGEPPGAATPLDPTPLASVAVPVRSLDLNDDDFADLEPLRGRIGDARVVVLGEGTHAEGTTSRAKARMVRFLHERMGFDVLVWESGRFSAQALDQQLRDPGVPLQDAASWLSTWGDDVAVRPLLQYARDSWQGPAPLRMAGMDRSRTPGAPERFLAEVMAASEELPALAMGAGEAADFHDFARRALSLQRPRSELPTDAERDRQRAAVAAWHERLVAARSERMTRHPADAVADLEYLVQDALDSEAFNWLAASDFGSANALRDRMMAGHLRWLLDNPYRGHKVIVWVATAHLLRDSTGIHHVEGGWDHPGWYAGNEIGPWLGEGLYTIAFTAYGGRWGFTYADPARPPRAEDMPPAPADSFEAAAHSLGRPALFVNLRAVPEDSWLAGPYVAMALGHEANRAVWRRHLDAFFYIDQAEPLAR